MHTLVGEPELILVHTEVQGQRDREFPYRMYEYYALLRMRHKVPVFPVVVYLAGGAGGIGKEVYREALFDEEILTFRYGYIGLPDLPAREYAKRPNPLAAALAARMNRRGQSAVEIKVESLQTIARSHVDEARTWLLLNFVETYLELGAEEQRRLRQLLEKEEYTEAKVMELTYEDKLKAKLTQELAPQIALGVKRSTLMQQLEEKFGAVPDAARRRIEGAESEAILDQWLRRLVKAQSLAELGLE